MFITIFVKNFFMVMNRKKLNYSYMCWKNIILHGIDDNGQSGVDSLLQIIEKRING